MLFGVARIVVAVIVVATVHVFLLLAIAKIRVTVISLRRSAALMAGVARRCGAVIAVITVTVML